AVASVTTSSLPIKRHNALSAPGTIHRPAVHDMPVNDDSRAAVAIVEDDREMRELLREALGNQGYAVVAVGAGAAADEVVRGGNVDAVVLDVWLPDGDGVELCRAWRRSGLRLPILMLT